MLQLPARWTEQYIFHTVSPFPVVLHHAANTPSHSALSYLFPAKYTLLLPFKNEKQPENVLLMAKSCDTKTALHS